MDADSSNLDPSLRNFMKRYFKEEMKAKQKANERALYEDEIGELNPNYACVVM